MLNLVRIRFEFASNSLYTIRSELDSNHCLSTSKKQVETRLDSTAELYRRSVYKCSTTNLHHESATRNLVHTHAARTVQASGSPIEERNRMNRTRSLCTPPWYLSSVAASGYDVLRCSTLYIPVALPGY